MKYIPKYLSLVFVLVLSAHICYAQQTKGEMLQSAVEHYQAGRFDDVLKVLDDRILGFSDQDKLQAYRLRSLSNLANDDVENASRDISEILKIEPYYTASIQDPVAYAKLIRQMQSGKLTLVTASQLAESLEEVPVPVTLITAEMIKDAGVKNLKEALTLFVPGMTAVESSNEVNVSMRGVYSSGQQKILIMLNGHRLNSRSYNGANPDYSISLAKVKQIEVLRGPASSLYGNVALTAVVNIITKDGMDVDGMEVNVAGGMYGEVKADVLIGKRFMTLDVMAWGSVYYSDGQRVYIPAEKAIGKYNHDGYGYLGAYNRKPSYDYGAIIKWNDFKLMFNQRYGKMVDPFSSVVNLGETYDYRKYMTFIGEGPGASFASTHADLSYQKSWGNFALDVAANLDFASFSIYTAAGDSATLEGITHPKIFQDMAWNEYAYGVIPKLGYQYNAGKWGKGNLILGMQFERYSVYDSKMILGDNYTEVFEAYTRKLLTEGSENCFSVFIQEKHTFWEKFIVNAGLRYDYKVRANDNNVSAVSPRVSLIYLPSDKWNIKASYSKSFVDAPYYYRFNVGAPSFYGSENLNPENLQSVQISAYMNFKKIGLSYEFNSFWNNLTDFIYNDKTATGTDPKYVNAGKLNTIGIENVLKYSRKWFSAQLNLTWQHVLNGEKYSFDGSRVYNIPPVSGSILLRGMALNSEKRGKLAFNITMTYSNKQLSPLNGVIIGGTAVTDMYNETDAHFIVNIGANYQWGRYGAFIQCNNLLDTDYYQGGTTICPYIQTGRWITGGITVKL